MTPLAFRTACQILWGDSWSWGAYGASVFLGISERNVKRFASGEKEIGPGLERAMIDEVAKRLRDPSDLTPALVIVRQALEPHPA